MTQPSWRLTWVSSAEKDFHRLPARHQSSIRKGAAALTVSPHAGPHIKKLRGELEGLYRLRLGDIRLVYRIVPQSREVRIIAIGFRGGVY